MSRLLLVLPAALACGAALAADALPGRPVAVAVLYFANRDSDPKWEWLSKGLADMLIADLSRCPGLQVVERERIQSLLDELALAKAGLTGPAAVAEAGKAMRVDCVLFGSFWLRGEAIEVEAHLLDAKTGKVERVESVQGRWQDVLSLQKELATKLIRGLDTTVTAAELDALRGLPLPSVDAAAQFYTGLDLFDQGLYEDALCRVRMSLRGEQGFAQGRHWLGNLCYYMGEYEHAAIEYTRCAETSRDDLWGAESAYHLARLCEMNLGDDDRAVKAYRTPVERYPQSRRARDAWRCLGMLHERRGEWLAAHSAYDKATGWSDMRHRIYLYAKVLETSGDVVEPPNYVILLDPARPHVRRRPHVEGEKPVWDFGGYFIKAPRGRQISRVHLRFKGQCRQPNRPGIQGSLQLIVQPFPPYDAPYYGKVETASLTPVTQEGAISLPEGTRILTVRYHNAWAEAEYWEGAFELAPLQKALPFRPAKPTLEKMRTPPNERLAAIPVARGGYNPCVTWGRDGRLWAVFNDVAEYGDYPWRPTGSLPDLWLTSSADGKEWTRPDLLPINSPAADHSASLMQAEDGRLFLAWVSGRGYDRKFRIWVSSSRDGKRWSQPRRVPVGAQFDLLAFPSLFQDSEGTFWLVFGAARFGEMFFHRYIENPAEFLGANGVGEVWMTSSRDAMAWTEPTLVLRPTTWPIRDISALRDRSGTFHVAWGRREKGVSVLSSSDGASWTTSAVGGMGSCIYPRLLEMAQGGLLLTYTEMNHGVVAAVSRDGKAWKRLGLLGSRREGAQTEVASVTLCGTGGPCAVRTGYHSFIRDVCVERTPRLPAN